MKFDKKHWPETVHGRWIEDDGIFELVSVIVPTYNREKYILETLDSVYAQTYRPIELIIVDDGSTDSTKDIIFEWKSHKESDDFSATYFHQENQGAPVARNKGAIESTGEFIQFLDSDDLLDPTKIRLQVLELIDNGLSLCVGSLLYIEGEEKQRIALVQDEPETYSLYERLLDYHPIPSFCTITPLFRRNLICSVGPWNEALTCYQDNEYGVRIFSINSKWCLSHKAYCYCRIDSEGPRVGANHLLDNPVHKRISYVLRLSLMFDYLPKEIKDDAVFRDAYVRRYTNSLLEVPIAEKELINRGLGIIKESSKGTSFEKTASLALSFVSCFGLVCGLFLFKFLLLLFRLTKPISQPIWNLLKS